MADFEETVEIEDTDQLTPQQPASQQPAPQQQAPQPPIQQQHVIGCPGDCNRCTPMHRTYCASQIAYNMQNAVARLEGNVPALMKAMDGLANMLNDIKTRLDDIEAKLDRHFTEETQQLDFFAPEPEPEKAPKTEGKSRRKAKE